MLEKYIKPMAAATAALALGGLAAKSAEAYPSSVTARNIPNQVDKKPKPGKPATMPKIDAALLKQFNGASKEAVDNLHETWEGTAVLYPPKNPSANAKFSLNFAIIHGSPWIEHAATGGPNIEGGLTIDNESDNAFVMKNPGVELINGKTYLMGMKLEPGWLVNKWGFIDVQDELKKGNLKFYKQVGVKEGPVSYNAGYLPQIKEVPLEQLSSTLSGSTPSKIVPHP